MSYHRGMRCGLYTIRQRAGQRGTVLALAATAACFLGCTFDGSGVAPGDTVSDARPPGQPDAMPLPDAVPLPDVDSGVPGVDAAGGCESAPAVCGYAWARRLTIDNAGISEPLDDIPVLVKLDQSRIDYNTTQNLGQDLRFMTPDFSQSLAFEIEKWQPFGTSYVWVKVPRIEPQGQAGAEFWMVYGNPGVGPGEQPAAVWSNGYVSVHHFDGDLADATGNGHDGVTSTPPSATDDGAIAGAMSFNGLDQFVALPQEQDFDFTDRMSVSVFIRVQSFTRTWQAVIAKGDTAWRVHRNENNNHLAFDNNDEDGIVNHNGNSRVDNGIWHHVLATYDGETKRLFVDGSQDFSRNYDEDMNRNDHPVSIGENNEQTNRWFQGEIDELRISSVPRSASWATAQHRSMTDDGFVIFGAPEPL